MVFQYITYDQTFYFHINYMRHKYSQNYLPINENIGIIFMHEQLRIKNFVQNQQTIIKCSDFQTFCLKTYSSYLNVIIQSGIICVESQYKQYDYDFVQFNRIAQYEESNYQISVRNNELLLKDKNGSCFTYKSNNSTQIIENIHLEGDLFGWCDLSILRNKKQITINNTETFELQFQRCSESQLKLETIFNGIAIIEGFLYLDGDYVSIQWFVNLIHPKMYKSNLCKVDMSFTETRMNYSCFGYSIPNRILLKVMGKEDLGEYLAQLEQYYDNWRFQQFSHPDFPLSNLNQLLKQCGQEEIGVEDLHFKRFRYRIEIEKQQEKRSILSTQINQMQIQNESRVLRIKQQKETKMKLISAIEYVLK